MSETETNILHVSIVRELIEVQRYRDAF